mgnify:FL=1
MYPNLIGELLGTMFLIILGDGVVANVLLARSKGENSGWIVIATGWGLAVLVGVSVAVAAGAPQGDINPAVTLGKYVAMPGTYTFTQMLLTILAETVGAFIGAIIVWLTYFKHWEPTEDPGLKLAVFSTGPAIRNTVWNLVTEIFGTIVLLMGVGALVGAMGTTGLVPYLVGMLVWGIGLSLGGPTGYAINPARDLGPRIAHQILPIPGKGGSDWGYGWIPVVGPFIGGVIGALLWVAFF